jgi:hypothetical protein
VSRPTGGCPPPLALDVILGRLLCERRAGPENANRGSRPSVGGASGQRPAPAASAEDVAGSAGRGERRAGTEATNDLQSGPRTRHAAGRGSLAIVGESVHAAFRAGLEATGARPRRGGPRPPAPAASRPLGPDGPHLCQQAGQVVFPARGRTEQGQGEEQDQDGPAEGHGKDLGGDSGQVLGLSGCGPPFSSAGEGDCCPHSHGLLMLPLLGLCRQANLPQECRHGGYLCPVS